ncbi:MAG: hypothetical protein ABI740_07225 [Alphaproteobacteria bacterium]
MIRRFILLAAIAALTACSGPAGLTPSSVDIPRIAEDFQLRDQNGRPFELYKAASAPAVVLLTQVNGDPVSRESIRALQALRAAPAMKGVVVALLNSTAGATREQLATEATATTADDLPFLLDTRQFVGETLHVSHGGEAFVIDPKRWAIVYHGPIDDRFGAKPAQTAKQTPVKDALVALTAGKPVAFASYDSGGARISFPATDNRQAYAGITYTKDVAPILLDKCAVCHVGNGVAPFAMSNYTAVKPFAFMVREAVRTERMPPVGTPRRDGPFAHVLPLTDDEARILVHWAEGGGARGEGEDILATMVKPLRAPTPEK